MSVGAGIPLCTERIPGEAPSYNGDFKGFYNVVSDLFVWYHTYNRPYQTYSYPILIAFD